MNVGGTSFRCIIPCSGLDRLSVSWLGATGVLCGDLICVGLFAVAGIMFSTCVLRRLVVPLSHIMILLCG